MASAAEQLAANINFASIGKAEELLPKTAPAPEGVDLAAQLKQAMRSNAFGDLRFSGRDPVEVIDELRAQWADAGPLLEDADRAQATQFEDVCKRVLEAANASAPVAAADWASVSSKLLSTAVPR